MASEKERMLSTANKYAGIVSQAQTACDNAMIFLSYAQETIIDNWQGESGDAIAQKLEEIWSELKAVSSLLSSSSSKMVSQANYIYRNWPEDDEEKNLGGGGIR